jgi:hypothetical protein
MDEEIMRMDFYSNDNREANELQFIPGVTQRVVCRNVGGESGEQGKMVEVEIGYWRLSFGNARITSRLLGVYG